jgi:hypothetical protein
MIHSGKTAEVHFVRIWNYMGTVSAGSGGNLQLTLEPATID